MALKRTKQTPRSRKLGNKENTFARAQDLDAVIDVVNDMTDGIDTKAILNVSDNLEFSAVVTNLPAVGVAKSTSNVLTFYTAGSARVSVDAQGDIDINGGRGIEGGATGVGTYWSTFMPLAAQQTIASANTAIGITSYLTTISNAGGTTHTMADGKVIGQVKRVVGVGALAAPAVITPANMVGTNVSLSVVGDTVDFIWDGTDWNVVALYNPATGVITTPTMT